MQKEICGMRYPSKDDYLGIAKYTLLEFFECIKNTLADKERECPERFQGGLLNIKPSTKMTLLQFICSQKSKEDIASLYEWFIIDMKVVTESGTEVQVESFLTQREEHFILKDIFKLMPAAKADDIALFSEIWKGVDKYGNNTKLVQLSEEEKEYAWTYFDIISKYIHRYRKSQQTLISM